MAQVALNSQKRWQDFRIHVVLLLLSAVFIIPLYWMIITSLKPIEETMKQPPTWIPSQFQWENFGKAFTYGSEKLGYIPFLLYGRNTLLICVLAVAGTVCS